MKELYKLNMMILPWKLILTRFGNFGTLKFDEKSFFNTLLGITPYWDYKPTNAIKPTNADSAGVYTSDKILNLIQEIKSTWNVMLSMVA